MDEPNAADLDALSQHFAGHLARVMTTGRFSIHLAHQLAWLASASPINPFNPIREIAALEGAPRARPSRTKPEAMLQRPPLTGLWHKHFSEGRHIGTILRNRWGRRVLREMIAGVTSDSTTSIEDKSKLLAKQFVHDGLADQTRHQKLTGDWIVFDRRDGVNTYLTLAGHQEPQDAIVRRVGLCRKKFPELFKFVPYFDASQPIEG